MNLATKDNNLVTKVVAPKAPEAFNQIKALNAWD